MTTSQSADNNASLLDSIEKRLKIQNLLAANFGISPNIGSDVIKGLSETPKSLPARYFYDNRGSELFEKICELPEYYLTRSETEILQKYAGEIADMTGCCELVELGSGSSTKTRILLNAYNLLGHPLRYLPIDVSAGMLETSARQLLADYPSLEVHAIAGTYELALSQLEPSELPTRMICFIGSTLGNLNSQECDVFFSQVTDALELGQYLLLGVDLQKPKHLLSAAYNDSQGVTAAFNLNILEHLNWRFDGNFEITQFEHWAFYNETEHQIEMHLRSLRSQTAELRALNFTLDFSKDETILTEISRKFNLNTLQYQLQAKGLVTQKIWTDTNEWFGLLLCQMQT